MNKNDDVFLKQMSGVSPLKKNNRVKKERPKTNHKNIKIKKITSTTTNTTKEPTYDTKKSEFNLERVGLNKSIKKGMFKIDKKIDFHGKSLLESEDSFKSTILECYESGHRCLLFVTGKGLFRPKNSENNNEPKLYHGVIRAAFVEWVRSKKFAKYILSYEKASIGHGGDGAFYVYLRKKKN
mgnify:CR=1 FL=1